MDEKHFRILQFLNEQKTPVHIKGFTDKIRSDFQAMSIRPGSLIHELDIVLKNKGLIKKSQNLNQHYEITSFGKAELQAEISKLKISSMTEVDKMNLLLSQLYTKPVGYSHHLDELSKATGLDLITIEVLGKKINDKGDCHYHHQGTSITSQGVYTVNNGGYKDDFLIPFMQYVDKSIAIHGDGNIFAPDNSGEIKGSKIQKNVDDKESKELNKKNLTLSRRNIYVALIAIAVAILIALWQQGCIG